MIGNVQYDAVNHHPIPHRPETICVCQQGQKGTAFTLGRWEKDPLTFVGSIQIGAKVIATAAERNRETRLLISTPTYSSSMR